VEKIELGGYLAQQRTPLAFSGAQSGGGAKLSLDISEDFEDAAYLVYKHMKDGKYLKITLEVIEQSEPNKDTA